MLKENILVNKDHGDMPENFEIRHQHLAFARHVRGAFNGGIEDMISELRLVSSSSTFPYTSNIPLSLISQHSHFPTKIPTTLMS